MFDFLWRAVLAASSFALVAGPLGSLMVWRRLAFFGETLAHGALLGIAISLLAQINLYLSLALVATAICLLLLKLQKTTQLGSDSALAILAHSSLALGLTVLAFVPGYGVDVNAYLFGDLLSINASQVYWIIAVCITALAVLSYYWNGLVAISSHEDLARTEGHNIAFLNAIFLVTMAAVIAVAIKIVGVLLITALLIIPASIAAFFAKSPEQMAISASAFALVSVWSGMAASYFFDIPAGPAVVLCASLLLLLSRLFRH